MPASFLHGVETVVVSAGSPSIQTVKTAVIGLVGTASKWTLADPTTNWQAPNTPVLVSSYADAVKYFGTEGRDSYTIPAALKAIFDQGGATCIVVNVLDPTTNNANITDEAVTLNSTTGVGTLLHAGATSVVVKHTSGTPTYVLGTDYTVDAVAGTVTRVVTGALTVGQALKISYSYMNPAAITATDIIGTIVTGNRTGAQCWLDAANRLGIKPKILIAPGYSSSSTTVGGFTTLAAALRAIWIGDVAASTTVANALLTRSTGGIFNTADARGMACYPYVKDSGGTLRPMSAYLAGALAYSDVNRGYWFSPSNVEYKGVSALERAVSFQVSDSTCDANTLNAAGITTAATGYGQGVRSWGNRNLSYPTSTLPQNFLSILRVQDVLWESVEYATLQWIDQPINQATINGIRSMVNNFIRELVGRGALIDGECTYNTVDNPPSQLAAGQLVFQLSFMPPPPAERITFNSLVNVDLLKKLR